MELFNEVHYSSYRKVSHMFWHGCDDTLNIQLEGPGQTTRLEFAMTNHEFINHLVHAFEYPQFQKEITAQDRARLSVALTKGLELLTVKEETTLNEQNTAETTD
tara:strand:+ start:208 stop:519 length:312 start_codon:yes stop_codon:yes gene_type:complete